MAATEPYVRNQLYSINLAELLPAPNKPRKFLNPATLKELTASIAHDDVPKHIPLQVKGSRNYVVAGDLRNRAAHQSCFSSPSDHFRR